MKLRCSIKAHFKTCVAICLFVFHFAQGSLNETLADIFSINIDNSETTTKALQDIGVELFKAISFKQPFDDSIDIFNFIKTIQAMDTSLTINKPKIVSMYPSQTDPYWQEIAKNFLNCNDQKEIIKIQKFLHLFADNSAISSDQIAEKIGLKNYMFFHDHCVKYALKISILNGDQDTLLDTYSHCVDPYFKILASYNEKANDYLNVYWFDGRNSFKLFARYPLEVLIYNFSTRIGLCYSLRIIKSVSSHINRNCPIEKIVQAPIHKLILSATHIQKYIRQTQTIDKYNKKKARLCLITYIKGWSAYCTLETLRYEKKFKIDPSKVRVPELPDEIWNRILCLSVESMGSLILVNKLCKRLVSSTIDNLKNSFSNKLYNHPLIQEIQAMDRSLVFDSRTYCDFVDLPSNNKKRKKYVLNMIEIPLNCTNRKKIKTIRQFFSAINTIQKPSHEIAYELGLKNYGFFYDQYFSYAIKILAYESLLNSSQYYKKYLECLDHTFGVELNKHFIINYPNIDDLSYHYRPNYPDDEDIGFRLEAHNLKYSINMENIEISKRRVLSQNKTVRMSLGNLLQYFKKNKACDIPDSMISYFQEPTYLKKKMLLDNSAQQALVATQAFIRSYNAQNRLTQYKDEKAIIKIQSAARRFLIQNNWDNMRRQFELEKQVNSFNFDAQVKKCDDLIAAFNENINRLSKEATDFEHEAKYFLEQIDIKPAAQEKEALKKQGRYFHIRRFLIGSGILASFCLLFSGFLQKMFFSIS